MKERSVLIVLGIVNVTVLGLLGGLYLKRDTTPPVITIEKDGFVYEEGMEAARLLEGVRAEDSEEGDVSRFLVVEKVVPNEGTHTALITYGARDSKGNMCKAACRVDMEGKREALLSELLPVAGEAGNRANGVIEEVTLAVAEEETEEATAEETASEETEETAPVEAASRGQDREAVTEHQEGAANVPANQTAEEPVRKEADTTAENPPAEAPPTETPPAPPKPAAGEAPTLRFGKTEVTTIKGQNPAWVNFIGELTDNKDNYEYLLNHLKIDGTYDREKEGSYTVKVSTVDSDGNESKATSVTITVQ